MKRALPILLLALALMGTAVGQVPSGTTAPGPRAPLASSVSSPVVSEAALRQALAGAVGTSRRSVPNLGVHVVDLGGDELDYAHRADVLLIPASNQKLTTTAAALSILGPDYTFETQLGLRGEVGEDGVLRGDLAVRGAGDPGISGRLDGDPYSVFRRWAAALQARGVRRVEGDLYLEHGLFAGPTVHPDWPPEQQMWWYEAPVAALSFSDNCLLLRAWGARRAGAPGVLEVVPRLGGLVELRNGLRTTTQRGKHHWAVDRKPGSRVVVVNGQVQPQGPPLEVWVTVPDPVQYFGAALRDALAQEGVAVSGETRPVERLPGPWWELVTTHRSLLVTALDVTNKRSQNFYAESLFKLLGARRCGDGSWQGGTQVVSDFLVREVGWQRDAFRIADGSGMSRNTRVTARQLTQLLEHMFGSRYGVEFMRSLPYAGEADASLHKRMTNAPYRGNVFAKTGTLGGVSSLSGYAKGRSGRLYAFAIIANGASAWSGRVVQDRIVQALVDNG